MTSFLLFIGCLLLLMKIFITGATGQVGFHLVEYLIKEKPVPIDSPSDIICLIRSKKKAADLTPFGVTLVEGTLKDKEIIKKVLKTQGVQIVIHNAGNIDTSASFEDFYRDNYIGTRNMVEAFTESNATTFVFASSVSVYSTFLSDKKDKKSVHIITENTPLGTGAKEGYSYTKRLCEQLIRENARRFPSKKFVITRIGPISGKRDRQILPNFITLLSLKGIPKLIGGGRDLFVITNPYDVARAQIFLATDPRVESGDVFNVSGGVISYREIYNIVCDYYRFPRPVFSVSMELFLLFRPLLAKIKKLLPNNQFINQALSESALGYIGKTYYYSTRKIESLGFKFIKTPQESLKEGLLDISKIDKYRFKQVGPFIVTFGQEFIEDRAKELDEALQLLDLRVAKKVKQKKKKIKILLRTAFCLLIWLLLTASQTLFIIFL